MNLLITLSYCIFYEERTTLVCYSYFYRKKKIQNLSSYANKHCYGTGTAKLNMFLRTLDTIPRALPLLKA